MKLKSLLRLLGERNARKSPLREKRRPLVEPLERRELLAGNVPRVLSVAPVDGSSTLSAHPLLSVRFSEAMNTADVTNPTNYLLFSSNGTQISIDAPLSYDSFSNTVTLSYNAGNDLTADTYTLFVRGDRLHDADDSFAIALPGRLIVANTGAGGISEVNMPGAGALEAISNYSSNILTSSPSAVFIGDVTGDGLGDLVVANSGASTLSVFTGLVAGGFINSPTVTVSLPQGALPSGIVGGDFNEDGFLDLAVANAGTSNVSVFLNNGSGSFAASQNFAAGTTPVGITTADFTGSGHLDLAVADSGTNTVRVLFGTGTGNFGVSVSISAGFTGHTGIASGVLVPSTKIRPDIAVSSTSGAFLLVNNSVNPGALVINQVIGLTTTSTSSIAIASLDVDNRLDIVATTGTTNGQALVFTNGLGGFSNGVPFAANQNPTAVSAGDVNGDSLNDIIVVGNTAGGLGALSVLRSLSGTSFAAPVAFAVDRGPVGLALQRNTLGGVIQAATANRTGNDVSVLLAKGDGTFGASTDLTITNSLNISGVVSGDFNGDLRTDVAISNHDNNTVQVLLANPLGGFFPPTAYTVGNGPITLTAADLTGTGRLDLLAVNQNDNSLSVLSNAAGTGVFTVLPSIGIGKTPNSIVVGDFNGDSNIDIAVSHNGAPLAADRGVTVRLGNGDRTFQAATEFLAGTRAVALAAADFDLDQKLDLAVVDGSAASTVVILRGQGDGTFVNNPADVFASGENATSIAVGDLNRDSLPDVVVTNESIPPSGGNPTAYVSVLLNTPGIGFSNSIRSNVLTSPSASFQTVAIVNINQDLFPDVVATSAVAGGINNIVTLIGNGDGTFITPRFYATGGGLPTIAPSFLHVTSDPFIRLTTFTALGTLVSSNVVLNGSFEKLDLAAEKGNLVGWQFTSQTDSHGGWLLQTGDRSPVSEVAVPQAPQGLFGAMLDQPNVSLLYSSALGLGRPRDPLASDYEGAHALYQDVRIPDNASSVVLSLQLYLNNNDETNNNTGYSDPNTTPQLDYFPNQPIRPTNQQVRIDILDPSLQRDIFDVTDVTAGGSVLMRVFQTLPTTPRVLGYVPITADLTQFRGRVIRLRIGSANNRGKLIIGVDNVQIQAAYPDVEAPSVTNLRLRNPGVGETTTFGGRTSDPTLVGQATDNGSPGNIAFVAIDVNNDGNFSGPEDVRVTRLDAAGNFAISLPLTLPSINAAGSAIPLIIGVQVVDRAGNTTTQSVEFVYQGPSVDTWVARGPGPLRFIGQGIAYKFISGRVQTAVADAHDPTGNTIYVGSDNGGVWKTTDGGANWTPLTDFLIDPTLGRLAIAVNTIAIDPNDPSGGTIYIGTGIPDQKATSRVGMGILKSTDGGKTFTLLGNDVFADATISKISISDDNPVTGRTGQIYVAVASSPTFGPGLLSSDDGGLSWNIVLDPAVMFRDDGTALGAGHPLASVTDFAIDRLSPDEEILYVALGNIGLEASDESAGVWKSVNRGGSWFQQIGGHDTKGAAVLNQTIPSGDLVGKVLLALPGETQILGPDGRLHPTGRRGRLGALSDEPVVYALIENLAVGPNDPLSTGVYKSRNGGQSWTHVMLRQNTQDDNPHDYQDIQLLGGGDEPIASGSLVVDPMNVDVFFVGGSVRFADFSRFDPNNLPHGLLRVDTTNMRDTKYLSPFTGLYPNDGDDIFKAADAAILANNIEPGSYPNGDAYTGEGVFWFDLQQNVGGASNHQQLLLPGIVHSLAFDGQKRLLIGTDGGVWRGVNQGWIYDTTSGAVFGTGVWSIEGDLGIETPVQPGMVMTDLNGNLQISDMQGIAIDPLSPDILHASYNYFGWAKTTGSLIWGSTNDTDATPENPVGAIFGFDAFNDPGMFGGQIHVGPHNIDLPDNPSVVYRVYAHTLLQDPPAQFQVSQLDGDQGTFYSITEGLDVSTAPDYPIFAVKTTLVNKTGTPENQVIFGSDRLYKSDDGGSSWNVISPLLVTGGDFISALAIANNADNVFYVGTNQGFLFATFNNGADGFPDRSAGLPGLPINSIFVDPLDEEHVFAAVGGTQTLTGHIFESTDGGLNWTDVGFTLPDVPAYSVVYDPRTTTAFPFGRLYAGTEVGAFVSYDLGGVWQDLGQGLPHVPVVDMQFDELRERLVVATQGRGAFQLNTDIHGPRVISYLPNVPQLPGLTSITINFDKPVDPRSFTTADITQLTGPNGPITPLSIVNLDPTTHQSYQITFVPQSTDGVYTAVIGPDITDFVGIPMDQDNNGLSGEVPNDRFTFQFTVNATDNGRFITANYHDQLRRVSDAGGFLNFLSAVELARFRELPRVSLGFVTSDEARGDTIFNGTITAVHPAKTGFYHELLRRDASPAEVAFWVDAYKQGLTPEAIIANIVASQEYFTNIGAGIDSSWLPQIYADLLNRAIDPTGQSGFGTFLANNAAAARTGIANALTTSTEFRTNLINALYTKYLLRAPTSTELSQELLNFQNGLTTEGLITSLAAGGEYFALPAKGNNDNSTWLSAIYQDILGRPIDPTGQAVFSAALQQGTSRSAIVNGLVTSGEYRTLLVEELYNEYLQRSPSASESAAAVAQLQQGGKDTDLINQLVGSDEYYQAQILTSTTQAAQDVDWINGAYGDVLDRLVPPSSGEVAGFLQSLAQAENAGRLAVAQAIVNSTEYRTLLISETYIQMLNRPAGAGDIAVQLQVLALPPGGPGTAAPSEIFVAGVLGSGEYFSLQVDPNTNLKTNAQWVVSLYNNVLGRAPDSLGFNANLENVLSGYSFEREAVARAINTSAEYRENFIRSIYSLYLRRVPSPAEISQGFALFAQGATDEQMIHMLVSSDEYFRNPAIGGNSNSVWLNRLYLDLLGRGTINDSGAASLLLSLNQRTTTRSAIANLLLTSVEYRNRLVTGFYTTLLGRAPSQGELINWFNALASGVEDEEVIAALIASTEYFQRQITPSRLPLIFP